MVLFQQNVRYVLYLLYGPVLALLDLVLLVLEGQLQRLACQSLLGLLALIVDEVDLVAEEGGVEEGESHITKGFDMIFGVDEVGESIGGHLSVLTQTNLALAQ